MIGIQEAAAGDLDQVSRLVENAQLPLAGLDDRVRLVIARQSETGDVVGSAALEEYPGGVLLRSVVVDGRFRGEGLGRV